MSQSLTLLAGLMLLAVALSGLAPEALAAQAPLAVLDFETGETRNLRIVGTEPALVEIDGHKCAELIPPRIALPMQWDPKMPNPGFPAVVQAQTSMPLVEKPKLRLNIDQAKLGIAGTQDLVFVVTVYDCVEGNGGSALVNATTVEGASRKKVSKEAFRLSGDPYMRDPAFSPRFVQKTILVTDMLLADALDGGDIAFESPCRLDIRRIEVYPAPPSTLDDQSARRAPGLITLPQHMGPKVFDVWLRDLSSLIAEQARAYAEWVDADTAVRTTLRHAEWLPRGVKPLDGAPLKKAQSALRDQVSQSLSAMDRFFYDGKVAWVRQDAKTYGELQVGAQEAQRTLFQSAAALRSKAEAAHRRLSAGLAKEGYGLAVPPDPKPLPNAKRDGLLLDRIQFAFFSNSPWDYADPFNATGQIAPFFGVDSKLYLIGAPAMKADGTLVEYDWLNKLSHINADQARGWDMIWGVGHHREHLMHELPAWLTARSPDALYDKDYRGDPIHTASGSMGIDIWDPAVRTYYQDVLTKLAGNLAGNPHTKPWLYWGEPNGCDGYGVAGRKAFTQYLQDKYGDITTLNKAWGATHVSFAAIQPPPPPGVESRTRAGGLTYEFEKFRRDGFTEWTRLGAAALRRGNPDARLWFEGWCRYDGLLSHGMDQYGLFKVSDLCAAHTGSMGQDCQRVWQLALSRYSGTPVSDGEINIYGPSYNGFSSLDMLRAAAESHVLMQTWYETRMFLFWPDQFFMYRVASYEGPRLYDHAFLGPLSPSCFAVRTVRAKADLYDPIVKATRAVNPRVGILYSSTSFINGWPYNELEHEIYPLHSWLYQSDYGYTIVLEDAMVEGKEDLHSYQVVLAPWAVWLQPKAAEVLLDFVKRGGVLISSGPIGAFDPYGKPLNTILEAALGKVEVAYAANERPGDNRLTDESVAYLKSIGDEHTTHFGGWAWSIAQKQPRAEAKAVLTLADKTPVVYEAPLGYGRLIVATGPLGKNGLRRFVLNRIAQHVVPLVRKTRNDGFHILPRVDAYDNLYLGVFNQNTEETVTDTLLVDGRYDQVVERSLMGAWPVPTEPAGDRTAIRLTLAPGEGTVLALGSMLAANAAPRDRQAPVTPEPDLVTLSKDELAQAEKTIQTGSLPTDAKAEALALLAGASRYRSFGYPDRAKRLMDQALATKRRGPVVAFLEDVITAPRAAAEIKIDGKATEWPGIRRYSVKGRGDAGGEFAFQWDERNLYILAVARDSELQEVEEQGVDYNWIWVYDGIRLVLNTANTAPLTVGGALYDAKYRATQTTLMVSLTGRKYANSPSGFSAGGVRSACEKTKGGYVMEVAVPLRDVMLPPVTGADVGMLFEIVNHGTGMGFSRFSDRENWQSDPLHFGRLRLVE